MNRVLSYRSDFKSICNIFRFYVARKIKSPSSLVNAVGLKLAAPVSENVPGFKGLRKRVALTAHILYGRDGREEHPGMVPERGKLRAQGTITAEIRYGRSLHF